MFNEAVGGAGGAGGTGGNGLGGGLFNQDNGVVTLTNTVVVLNQALGGTAGVGGSDGQGVGGGIYIVSGGMVCADAGTVITSNHASTSDDDVHGDLCSDSASRKGSSWDEAATRLFGVPGATTGDFNDPSSPAATLFFA